MLTPGSSALVESYRARGRFVLRRSRKVGIVALVFVGAFTALFVDMALSEEQRRAGYLALLILSPLLVIGLVFGVRQLLPGGAVVVDRDGIHAADRDVAWAELKEATVESTPGWRSYNYVRLHLVKGEEVDLPLLLEPAAHDQWFAINHLAAKGSGTPE